MDDIRIRPTTVKELVSNLRDLGLHVTDTDFIKPSNARTIVIFKYLLAMFVPWRAIAFEQLSFDAAQRLFLVIGTSPSSSSLDEPTLFELFRHFLASIQFGDFQIHDLLTPTPHHHVAILSAVNNYAVLTPKCKKIFDTFSEKLDQQTENVHDLTHAKINTTAEYNMRKEQKEQEEIQVAEYEDDNRQIREELNKLKKEADEGSNTLELRKKERQQYKDDLTGFQFAVIESADQFNIFLRNQDIDIDEINKKRTVLNQKIERTKQDCLGVQHITRQLKTELAAKKNEIINIEEGIQLRSASKRLTGEMNRLIKNLNAFQHEMRKGYEQELELKQINSQLELDTSNCEVELEKCEEREAKLNETMENYWETNANKNVELDEILEKYRLEESKTKEELILLNKEFDELSIAHNDQMRQVEVKWGLVQTHIDRLYQESQEF